MTFDQCCRAILAHCSDPYAKAYAKRGLGMEGEERRVQALYILNNITHWRSGPAREVRAALKGFAKKESAQ